MMKVLIITYYWPPAGGPGVQRVLKFAKYLPQFGWEPVILTVENGNYPAIDEELLEEIPENIKVYKTKTLEPFALYNRMRGASAQENLDTFTITKTDKSLKEKVGALIRKYLFIPDARLGWRKYAVSKGLELVEKEKIDLIFSSSPPHSLQLAAKDIAAKTGIPWVADFRDPWSDAFWLDDDQKKGWSYKRNKSQEASVLDAVNHFVTVSGGVLESFKEKYKAIAYFSSVIYNGFDDDDFQEKPIDDNKRFTIRYIGTLAESQNPEILFKVLEKLKSAAIDVEFWGKFDASVMQSVKSCNLEGVVSFHPYVSHKKAIELMQSSDLLLLVIPFGESKGILTGKLFEYMATKREILGLGPDGDEAGDLIEENSLGAYFSGEEGLYDYLEGRIKDWAIVKQSDKRKVDTDKFSRKYLTQQLAGVFNNLTK